MEEYESAEELELPEKEVDEKLTPEGVSSIQGNPEEKPPEKTEEKPQIPDDQFLKVEKLEKEPINTEQNPQEFTYPQDDQGIHEVGNADELAKYWHFQGATNDCALYSQGSVLEANGKGFDIENYRNQAIADRSYTPEDGMNPAAVGDLLEQNGVEINRYEVASFQDMERELQMGNGVITIVEDEPLSGYKGGHALWVTGMEIGKDGIPVNIITNDSGVPDGRAIKYPYEDFKKAWLEKHNSMITTKEPLKALQ